MGSGYSRMAMPAVECEHGGAVPWEVEAWEEAAAWAAASSGADGEVADLSRRDLSWEVELSWWEAGSSAGLRLDGGSTSSPASYTPNTRPYYDSASNSSLVSSDDDSGWDRLSNSRCKASISFLMAVCSACTTPR